MYFMVVHGQVFHIHISINAFLVVLSVQRKTYLNFGCTVLVKFSECLNEYINKKNVTLCNTYENCECEIC